MRDIAQAVGIQQSAIYNHFPSKQDLLADLMEAHMMRVLAALRAQLAGLRAPAQRLEAYARFHVTYHIDHAEDVFLAYMELRSLEEPGLGRVRALRTDYCAIQLEQNTNRAAFIELYGCIVPKAGPYVPLALLP